MKAEALKATGVNILVFLGLMLVIEATGQLIAVIRPSYDVLFLQPGAKVGWKQVPNLRWAEIFGMPLTSVLTSKLILLGSATLQESFQSPRE